MSSYDTDVLKIKRRLVRGKRKKVNPLPRCAFFCVATQKVSNVVDARETRRMEQDNLARQFCNGTMRPMSRVEANKDAILVPGSIAWIQVVSWCGNNEFV